MKLTKEKEKLYTFQCILCQPKQKLLNASKTPSPNLRTHIQWEANTTNATLASEPGTRAKLTERARKLHAARRTVSRPVLILASTSKSDPDSGEKSDQQRYAVASFEE
ncbi:hypothetical protein AAFF_G00390270 [Aldrovandia affinis]|uniref:Uncharacterized protein n=1 Tax=Aldrovandia affinis TaxID=143900 RepID=A0AAD7WLG5_9TELE|nr:hypothetical protein AAFF_G00390270 [Aldrovandia affinis]